MPDFIIDALGAAGTTAAEIAPEIGGAVASAGEGLGEFLGTGGEIAAGGLEGAAAAGGELGAAGLEGAATGGLEASLQPNLTAFSMGDVIGSPFGGNDAIAALGGVAGGAPSGATELAGLTGAGAPDVLGGAAGGGVGGGLDAAAGGVGAQGGATELAGLTGSPGGVDAAAGGVAKGAAGGGGLLDSLTGSVMKNPLGIGVAGAGLGYNIIKGQQPTANEKAVANAAGTQSAQGAALQQYIQNGTLPPGLQAMIDNATKAAKAQMVSSYAAKGLNADPNQNSQLAQDLGSIDMKAAESAGQLGVNLLSQGINETNMSNQLYQFLVGVDQKQSALMGQAISNFSSALAGGPKTIQIGGTNAVA